MDWDHEAATDAYRREIDPCIALSTCNECTDFSHVYFKYGAFQTIQQSFFGGLGGTCPRASEGEIELSAVKGKKDDFRAAIMTCCSRASFISSL